MQIPSSPLSNGTAASLSVANRFAVSRDTVETRSPIMPAVQQATEVEASINRQNPANRPTLVDEEVRLYGPFNAANSAANNVDAAATEVPDRAPPGGIIVDEQAQNRQSQQGRDNDAPAGDDTEASAAARADELAEGADRRAERREARTEQLEQQQISQLASRDREVRAHESAHASIGGQYAGNASFSMKRGPNGVSYATGGEVPIDVSAVAGDPEATIRKMQTVQRAALAPAQPSAADRSAAARAAQVAVQARAELQSEQAESRASQVETSRQQLFESAQRRAQISERMTDIQNSFNFSNELAAAQRSRQIAIVAQEYSPLRPGTIGTLFDESV